MKKLLLLLSFFIVGYMVAQPPCGDGCTTCPGHKICVGCTCENSVPIELLQFSAVSKYDHILLEWITLSETNNDYYELQRSVNCIAYQTIGIIDGSGNSTSIREYKFIDSNPFWGVAYYRLIQNDYDGTQTCSNIVATQLTENQLIRIEAYDLSGRRISLLDIKDIVVLHQYYSDGSITVEKIKKQ